MAASLLLGTSTLALSAHAADLTGLGATGTEIATPPAAQQYSWTAFHLGLSGGYGVANHNAGFQVYEYMELPYEYLTPGRDVISPGASIDFGGRGAIAAIEGGFDYQIGRHFVVGLLGDYTLSRINTVGKIYGDVCYELAGPDDCDTATVSDTPTAALTLRTGNSWSIGGRVGVLANPRTLFYGLLAYTRTQVSLTGSLTSEPGGTSATAFDPVIVPGLTYGFGVETLLTSNISAKLEYRVSPVNIDRADGDTSFGWALWDHALVQTVRGTISYRFPVGQHTYADEPMSTEDVSWTGFHLGAEGGYGGVNHNVGIEVYDRTLGGLLQIGGFPGTIEGFDLFSLGTSIDLGGHGPIESLSAGYDFQIGNRFVFGLLGDYTFSNVTATASAFAAVCFDIPAVCNAPQDPLMPDPNYRIDFNLVTGNSWTVGARAGFLAGQRTLIYGLAAYSDMSMDANITVTTPGGTSVLVDHPFSRNAFTFGAGIEAMVTSHITAKLEYRGTVWSNENILLGDTTTGVRVFSSGYEQTVRAGLSWRFGG